MEQRLKNSRVGIRISADMRDRIDRCVSQGKAKNLSEFVKQAVDEKLDSK